MGFLKLKAFLRLNVVLIVIGVLLLAVGCLFAFKPDLFQQVKQLFTGSIPRDSAEAAANVSGQFLSQGTANNETVLVKFKAGTSTSAASAVHKKVGSKVKKQIERINVQVVSLPKGLTVGQTINKLKAYKEVEYVEENFYAEALFTPNDPLYSGQWALKAISAPTAWDDAKGEFGPIAVIDTGVLSTHPDLAGEVSAGYNFVANTTNTTDDNGHGTHVSGIVSGVTDNSVGISSIGYKSTILPVKVLDSSGSGTYANVANGIVYAADKGAKVINMSLGGPSTSLTLQNAVDYAKNKGVLIVAAAGNGGTSAPLYPAACKGVLAVSATDSADNIASFSSYGNNIFVGAPGVSVNSTYKTGYASLSGTSMATPHLVGLLELAMGYAKSTGKTITNDQLIDNVKQTSDKVGSFSYDANGWNQYFGYGRINAAKLIAKIKGVTTPSPTPTQTPVKTATQTATSTATVIPTATKTGISKVPSKVSFNVILVGTVDSISDDSTYIRTSVKTINQKLKVVPKSVMNLFVNSKTVIKSKGKTIKVGNLKSGNKISVKLLWSENKLTAQTITVQGN